MGRGWLSAFCGGDRFDWSRGVEIYFGSIERLRVERQRKKEYGERD